MFRPGKVGCCQNSDFRHGEGGNHQEILVPLVLYPSHGQGEGQRLKPFEDHRLLNNATIHDRYSLPNIASFTSRIAGSTVFSRLDLLNGYYQIPMASKEILTTALVTPWDVRVPPPSVWSTKHWQQVPEDDGSNLR